MTSLWETAVPKPHPVPDLLHCTATYTWRGAATEFCLWRDDWIYWDKTISGYWCALSTTQCWQNKSQGSNELDNKGLSTHLSLNPGDHQLGDGFASVEASFQQMRRLQGSLQSEPTLLFSHSCTANCTYQEAESIPFRRIPTCHIGCHF